VGGRKGPPLNSKRNPKKEKLGEAPAQGTEPPNARGRNDQGHNRGKSPDPTPRLGLFVTGAQAGKSLTRWQASKEQIAGNGPAASASRSLQSTGGGESFSHFGLAPESKPPPQSEAGSAERPSTDSKKLDLTRYDARSIVWVSNRLIGSRSSSPSASKKNPKRQERVRGKYWEKKKVEPL